jgi:hypothetical protein
MLEPRTPVCKDSIKNNAVCFLHLLPRRYLSIAPLAASEKYRDDLRQREEQIRNLREAASLHEVENAKWVREHENYENRIVALENELAIAQQAHAQLDEQKQENLLLKETIDRMRFDMDEMRSNAVAATGGSGQSSAANTMSKSLGAELLGKIKGGWGMQDEEEDAKEEDGDVPTEVEEDEETESEDVIQTIITRKKRVSVSLLASWIFANFDDMRYRRLQVARTSWRPRHFHSKSPRNTRTVPRNTSLAYSPFLALHKPTLHPKSSGHHSAPRLTDLQSRPSLSRPTPNLSPFPEPPSRWRFKQTRFRRKPRDLRLHKQRRAWPRRHQLSFPQHPKRILSL